MNDDKPEITLEAGGAKIPVQRVVSPLLPCPFCGGKAERCDCDEDCCNRIVCKNCRMEMVSDLDDFEHNVNVWNKRKWQSWFESNDVKPKLYKKVLVKLINGSGKRRKALAEYIPEKTVIAEDFMHDYWIDDHPDEEYAPAGWYEMTEEHEVQYPLTGEITHWMYLEG